MYWNILKERTGPVRRRFSPYDTRYTISGEIKTVQPDQVYLSF